MDADQWTWLISAAHARFAAGAADLRLRWQRLAGRRPANRLSSHGAEPPEP